ncbi:hypothetical protein LEP1GSC188_3312 [Leptospira weilii serovar Topaz str. LT2116]|uniref:Uncharacterized protein n=1 Tax=Leptospira weilii serovar Topaz str. LT2116 TaxID=1088540 RepID=M3FPH3_9LEPT|nr:hypothetical protein LEP1GSC188_3312 [Leptospira weilii serovar Topaz str. LT2116]
MNKRNSFILFLFLFGVSIFSIEDPLPSPFEPYHLSRDFDLNRQKYLQVIAIPYKDPMELKLGPENNSIPQKKLPRLLLSKLPDFLFQECSNRSYFP